MQPPLTVTRLRALLAASIAMTASALLSPSNAAAPVAPVRDVEQTLHGVTVHDPYRYFENLKDPEVQTWLRA